MAVAFRVVSNGAPCAAGGPTETQFAGTPLDPGDESERVEHAVRGMLTTALESDRPCFFECTGTEAGHSYVKRFRSGTEARSPPINETAPQEWARGGVDARTHCPEEKRHQALSQDAIGGAQAARPGRDRAKNRWRARWTHGPGAFSPTDPRAPVLGAGSSTAGRRGPPCGRCTSGRPRARRAARALH
jgi:hypothetical protein